ncbi:hypothetical protein F2Q70_00037158 [Brassica cretica]|uniref:Uncharacterized protein n=1 Tax=Brassica cretica TaxID=69181 RepID=A0A8S9JWU7_BRACR|nr:hypothetical protein F2Q68_00032515 [Brassica cretica]KAF2585783.1 hypothetical protein F2Q70_00037158 [Brassica cretica]
MNKKPFSVLFSPIPQQRLDGLTLSPPVVSHQHRKPSDEFLRAVDQDIADFTINITWRRVECSKMRLRKQ